MVNTSMSNMAEHKRLDYNAPLLSVRRFASPARAAPSAAANSVSVVTSSGAEDGGGAAEGEGWLRRYSLPFYKSELKSGPVRNPGVVPFVWEQSPGRPKDGCGASGDGDSPQKPLQRQAAVVAAPKSPPSVTPPIPSPTSASPATAAATSTPFSASFKETSLAKSMERSVEGSTGKAKAKPMMAAGQALEEDSGGGDEEDGGDDAFSDALDALSRTESCLMNCSTSGLSGGIAVRDPSGSFSTDAQVRDFMMDRFLPAAQAMTAGSPQLASRKPPVPGRDPPRRALVDGGGRRPIPSPVPLPHPYQHRPRYSMYDAVGYHHVGFSGGRNGRDDGRVVDAGRLVKGRGWLPRLCLKGSLCLLNPIPAMKVRSTGHMVNCSDRRSQFTMESQRFEGGFVVKAFAESTLQCQGPVLAPAPGDLCFIERPPYPVKQFFTEDSPRTDHGVRGSRPSKAEEHEKKEVDDDGLEDLLPPALPKSPSESWLCQTLPSVLSKDQAPQPFLGHVQLHSKRQAMIRATSADPRWETMAKTSALPKCGMRFVDVLSRPADED